MKTSASSYNKLQLNIFPIPMRIKANSHIICPRQYNFFPNNILLNLKVLKNRINYYGFEFLSVASHFYLKSFSQTIPVRKPLGQLKGN